jgi:hypothetical protein
MDSLERPESNVRPESKVRPANNSRPASTSRQTRLAAEVDNAPTEPNWLEPSIPADESTNEEPSPTQARVEVIAPPTAEATITVTPPPAPVDGHYEEPTLRLCDRLTWRLEDLGLLGPPAHGRFRLHGSPLQHTSWLKRRYSFAFMAGEIFTGDPIANHIQGTPGFLGSFRFGWDFDHFWGLELRFGTANIGIRDVQSPVIPSNMTCFLADLNLQYYPWGDTRWRPYGTVGLGLANFAYTYALNSPNQTAGAIPFGVGLKYRHNERVVLRFEFLDVYTFRSGSGLDAMNNLTLLGGIEWRLGFGSRRSYWPWNSSHTAF